jgi:hypothetical protein
VFDGMAVLNIKVRFFCTFKIILFLAESHISFNLITDLQHRFNDTMTS